MKNKEIVSSEEKLKRRQAVIKLVKLIVIIGAVFAFYRIMLLTPIFPYVFAVYLIALTVFIFVYILYNRGMSRKGVTEDMLPREWSREMKTEYIEDGKRRLKKTEWMLMLIMGFVFTFVFELLELWALPWLESMLTE